MINFAAGKSQAICNQVSVTICTAAACACVSPSGPLMPLLLLKQPSYFFGMVHSFTSFLVSD